jgi:hypothetical protein
MSHRWVIPYFFCTLIIVFACLGSGCTSGQGKAVPSTPITVTPETPATIITPGVTQWTNQFSNLSINQNAELHSGNLSLVFLVSGKNRDPIKQTVSFELTVKNAGNTTVADIQKQLSDLFAVDRSGKQYSVPTHVALIGLKPGETRSGIVEIVNVPDQALPGLTFHYRFGKEEASWVITPDTTV